VRLAFVTTRYPPRTGGVEAHVAALATRFAARGHEVVVHTADAGPDVGSEVREGVRIHRHRGAAPGGAFHVAPGVVPAVARTDADLVHAHNYHSLPLVFAALAVSLPPGGPPLVATPHYHGGSASPLRDRLLSAYRPVGRWALRRSDAVLAVSRWERDRLRRDLGVGSRVIPNGLDVERFAAARRAGVADGGADANAHADADPAGGAAGTDDGPPGADADRPYLLCVGRLEAYKGVQHVVRALPDLPDYDLVVAGSGPHGEALRRTAREAGVADRVRFAGYVDDADLPALYAGAAAFVTMSRFEAYGLTVAEALAAGTPCVVRPAGALVDWADRADCVAAGPDALADAVREAAGLDAPAEPLPTWDGVADRVEAVYEDVLAGA
jgi:glycosyltransferase involved in cell wall biosynthesis